MQYDFFSGSIAEITDWLNKGLLDFGVVVAPVDMQKYDYIKLPVNDRFGVVMRKDCPLAKLHSIRPEDIGDYPVWVAHQQIEGNVLSSWLGRDLQSLNIVSTFNLITTPAMMIEEGFGMAFTFDHLVSTGENSSLCFRPLEPKIEADIFLIWKKYQMFTRAASIFLEEVRRKSR
ncbi:MAG: LysR family transcriptional regulator substrate-binding protein [Christensenellaceae bacterium]